MARHGKHGKKGGMGAVAGGIGRKGSGHGTARKLGRTGHVRKVRG